MASENLKILSKTPLNPVMDWIVSTTLTTHTPANSDFEVLAYHVGYLDRTFEEVIKVKWDHKHGVLTHL